MIHQYHNAYLANECRGNQFVDIADSLEYTYTTKR